MSGDRRRGAAAPASAAMGAGRMLARTVAAGLALLMTLLVPLDARSTSAVDGHVLVMFEDPGCVYCRRWHAEVGPGYAKSPEGRFAPLARRRRGDADVAFVRNIAYSPTFVLLRGSEEIGRIVGYGGADFFWGELEQILAQAGFKPEAAPAPPALSPVPLRETRLGGRSGVEPR